MKAKHFKSRHALLMSLTSLTLCVSMLFGATFAWFTDSVTSGVNRIVSGNLDVELYHSNGAATNAKVDNATQLFNVAADGYLWEPGAVAYETFEVKNAGSLSLKYQLSMLKADNNTLKNDTTKSLLDVIKVGVIEDGTNATTRDGVIDAVTGGWTTLGSYIGGSQLTGTLDAGASKNYTVVLYWEQSDNDNTYNLKNGTESSDGQPLYVDLGVALAATQNTKEADSFDINYDASAALPTAEIKPLNGTATTAYNSAADTTVTVGNLATATVKSASTLSNASGAIDSSTLTSLTLEVEEQASGNDATVAIATAAAQGDSVLGFDVSLFATTTTTTGGNGETETTAVTGSTELITATLNIGTGKEITAVYHKNAPLTETESETEEYYAYDGATGILTLYVKSFSPFAVAYKVPATGIALDETAEVAVGKTVRLNATLTPADSTDSVTWTSSDPSIATVDTNGVVTGVADGTATITATAGGKSATCTVNIIQRVVLTRGDTSIGYGQISGLGYIKESASSTGNLLNDLKTINGDNDSNKNVTITLYDDITLSTQGTFGGSSLLQRAAALNGSTDKLNITIDLNGHTITGDVNKLSARTSDINYDSKGGIINIITDQSYEPDRDSTFILNIIDGSNEKTGAIINSGEAPAVYIGNYVTQRWNVVVNIQGGTFRSAGSNSVEKNEYQWGHNNTTTLNITGGTFSSDPSNFVDGNTHSVTNNGNGTWTVTPTQS